MNAARPTPRLLALSCLLAVAMACSAGTSSAQTSTEAEEAGAAEAAETAAPEVTGSAGPVVDPAERVIYFVLIDRFANGDPSNDLDADPEQLLGWFGGDFAGLAEKMPYLAELGVTTIWINPIVDQIDHSVEGAGLPHWGYHGYWAEDFTTIDPHLGSDDDLRAMIAAAHANGLEVILDVVINHPGYHSSLTQRPGFIRECPGEDDPHDDLTQCLFGLPDFRTEDSAVAQQLIAWQTPWFEQFDFDGLRADTVKHVDADVWRQFLVVVRSLADDPNFWALGESWGTAPGADMGWLGEGLFDAMYDFGFADLVVGWVNGRMRSVAMAHNLGLRNDEAVGRYVPYLNTHDTQTMVSMLESPEAYPLALTLLLTSAGMPLLYYGDEVAREGGEWPHNRPPMMWDRVDNPDGTPLELVRQLLAVRSEHPALARGSFEQVAAEEGLLVYRRQVEGDQVVVGLNRGPEAASVACVDGVSCTPSVCHNCEAGEGGITLQPWGAVVLTSE